MTTKKRNHAGNIAYRVYHQEPTELPDSLRTQQQFRDECDINRIVKNAERGIPPRFLARGTPQFGDFSNTPSIEEAYDTIQRAHSAFMNLPSQLRLELDNDPANINRLTQDQAERYKLLRELPPQPAVSDPVTAGQAEPKAQPKKSAKADGDS